MTGMVKTMDMSRISDLRPSGSLLEDLPVELLLAIHDELPDAMSRACFALTSKHFFLILDSAARKALQPSAEILKP